jgi:hypothetical protein
VNTAPAAAPAPGTARVGPPIWLVAATAALAFGTLAMAVAETSLWMHYLIDAGESISLLGLGFIVVAGVYLYSRKRLLLSLPLAIPWLLFPVITQGDQIIDNLSITGCAPSRTCCWRCCLAHRLPSSCWRFATPWRRAPLSAGARRAKEDSGGVFRRCWRSFQACGRWATGVSAKAAPRSRPCC